MLRNEYTPSFVCLLSMHWLCAYYADSDVHTLTQRAAQYEQGRILEISGLNKNVIYSIGFDGPKNSDLNSHAEHL
jgi:hypothetical protein